MTDRGLRGFFSRQLSWTAANYNRFSFGVPLHGVNARRAGDRCYFFNPMLLNSLILLRRRAISSALKSLSLQECFSHSSADPGYVYWRNFTRPSPPKRYLCSSEHQKRLDPSAARRPKEEICLLYKGRWMVPFYVLVRLKVLQLVGFAALAIPVNAWFSQVLYSSLCCHRIIISQGSIDIKVMASSIAVMIGSAVASTSLWYYSKRYVGALALVGPNQDTVRFSVMDFWGNRTVSSPRPLET